MNVDVLEVAPPVQRQKLGRHHVKTRSGRPGPLIMRSLSKESSKASKAWVNFALTTLPRPTPRSALRRAEPGRCPQDTITQSGRIRSIPNACHSSLTYRVGESVQTCCVSAHLLRCLGDTGGVSIQGERDGGAQSQAAFLRC